MNRRATLLVMAATVLGGGLYAFGRSRVGKKPGERPAARDPGAATALMRQNALTGNPKQFGLTPVGSVWGVLMEMGDPEGWASLVALSDGSASLYFSGGGGIIGGGFHEKVKKAAVELCRLADAGGRRGSIVTTFPTPGPGRIRFYFLTTDGVRTLEEAEDTLGAGRHELSPLFFAGHEVITQIRLATEKRDGG